MKYLLIGGGIAAHRAAEEIRKLDAQGTITLVSAENHPLYSRVMLPHYLHGKTPRSRVYLVNESWYAEKKIDFHPRTVIAELNPVQKIAKSIDGKVFEYDKVLIATGGDALFPKIQHPHAQVFRTLDDADQINEAAKLLKAQPENSRTAGVLGTSFIGIEFMNLFHDCGANVHVHFRGPHFWSKALSPESAAILERALVSHGHALHPGSSETEFQKACPEYDVVGIGIGIKTAAKFLKETAITQNAGIVVNEFLETNVPDVWAAGDCTEYWDVTVGRHVMSGNWLAADMQGRQAGKMMAGAPRTPFALVTSYATRLLGMPITMIGDTSREHAEEITVEKIADSTVEKMYRNKKLVGAILVNRTEERMALTKVIGNNHA